MISQIKKIYRKFIHRNPDNFNSGFHEKPAKDFIPELSPYPSMIMIDTTTRCNLACKHCPSSKLSKIPGYLGDIDVDLYKKIICEVARENLKTIVRPFDGGEPFMRKDIEELIKYTKDKGIEYVSINTNGLLMTPERCEKILESRLDHIEISIDATSPQTYFKIRGSRSYEKLLKHIDYLNKLRMRGNSGLRITVSFVKQRENHKEEHSFFKLWQNKVDNICIREYHQHNRWIDGNGVYKNRTESTRYPCPYLWERLIINHNGKVRFCESDWLTNQTVVGDVTKQSIKEIWISDLYQQVRQSHLDRTFKHPFCINCSDWQEIKW